MGRKTRKLQLIRRLVRDLEEEINELQAGRNPRPRAPQPVGRGNDGKYTGDSFRVDQTRGGADARGMDEERG